MKKQSGKKLVEILAVELKEWPLVDGDYPKYIVQEGDGELFSTVKRKPRFGGDAVWYRADEDDSKCGYWDAHAEVAVDYATAIVTRAQWEAERAKLEGEKVMRACVEKCEPESKPKANKDGWICHRGGKCPVEEGTAVDIRVRSGEIAENCKALTVSPKSTAKSKRWRKSAPA